MHFRLLHSSDEWLTASDLFDEQKDQCFEIDLTIASTFKGHFNNQGKKSTKTALRFIETMRGSKGPIPYKPLGCCIEICDAITNITGTDNPRKWVGHKITLYVEMRVRNPSGGTRPAIRVRPFRPDQQQAARGPAQGSQQQQRPAQSKPAPADWSRAKPAQGSASQQPALSAPTPREPHPNDPTAAPAAVDDEDARLDAEAERHRQEQGR